MKAEEIFDYKGVRYKVENEKSEFSCRGCAFVTYNKNKIGCAAKNDNNVLSACKHNHVIFVKA